MLVTDSARNAYDTARHDCCCAIDVKCDGMCVTADTGRGLCVPLALLPGLPSTRLQWRRTKKNECLNIECSMSVALNRRRRQRKTRLLWASSCCCSSVVCRGFSCCADMARWMHTIVGLATPTIERIRVLLLHAVHCAAQR